MTNILKKICSLIFTVSFLLPTFAFANNQHVIADYHQIFIPGYNSKNELRIAIRMFYSDNTQTYLAVDPQTFTTETIPVYDFRIKKIIINNKVHYVPMKELMATPYMMAMTQYTQPPFTLENYGMTHATQPTKGFFLTVDMCPSSKPFEKEFFDTLVALADKTNKPFPVAISITGLWIIGHPEEFKWLTKQIKDHKLDITWTNHSFSHPYYADLPLEKNFLLEPHTNVTEEILATEKILLEHDQLPSVFFRFPGLVSNERLVMKLYKFGLIPLSTDAWLAKDETPKAGSIILIHGNGNEPKGIQLVMLLLKNLNNQWLPLPSAVLTPSQEKSLY